MAEITPLAATEWRAVRHASSIAAELIALLDIEGVVIPLQVCGEDDPAALR
jgi:hypothetical protein